VRYLGMDVHAKSTVWGLLDAQGEVIAQGRVETSAAALDALVRELLTTEEVVAGQEFGTRTYLVRAVRHRLAAARENVIARGTRAAGCNTRRNGALHRRSSVGSPATCYDRVRGAGSMMRSAGRSSSWPIGTTTSVRSPRFACQIEPPKRGSHLLSSSRQRASAPHCSRRGSA
jgi:hypothetical protein